MAYDDYQDRDLDLDEQARLYEEEVYENDTFGERVNPNANDPDSTATDDLMMEEELVDSTTPTTKSAEEGFGETINTDNNPHLGDQLEDEKLSNEAEADYTEGDSSSQDSKDESLLDRAKGKIDEWTGNDKRS